MSMKWFTRAAMSASAASMRFGANNGSRILRYFEWLGGSTDSGMSGRTLPSEIPPKAADENRFGSWSTSSTAARLAIITLLSPVRCTAAASSSSL